MWLNINKLQSTLMIVFLFSSLISFGKKGSELDHQKSIHFNFYNESVQLIFNDQILIEGSFEANENSISEFYTQMESTPYQSLLDSLKAYQNKFQLNDWLFYELIRASMQQAYEGKSDLQKELTNWFFLTKAGYDTRLTYLGDYVFVYVHSNENIFETPLIEVDGKTFINLSNIHRKVETNGIYLNIHSLEPNENGKSFSFELNQLPNFKPVEKNRKLRFKWRNQEFNLNIKFDLNLINIMEHYPLFEEAKYIQTPLSNSAATSLLPQFKKILKFKTEIEALEIIAIFTRSAFRYKDDQDYFGRNKPMIGDELFHYPYSDCEDRSALFYYLVDKLLRLPMIVIAYDDHLTIAVATTRSIGKPIRFENRKYFICDPTGPYNSEKIGNAPIGYRNRSFEILKTN